MSRTHRRTLFSTLLLAAAVAFAACSEDSDPPPADPGTDPISTGGGGRNGASNGSAEGGTTAPEDSGSAFENCGEGDICAGLGKVCILDEETGRNRCACAEGYEAESDGEKIQCVPDTSCVKIRFLEDRCRFRINAEPAVGLFFAVDYCAGNAVLPEDLGNLDEAFQVLEDGEPLDEDVDESVARVIERDVESFVTIALDVSDSLIRDGDLLSRLVAELRNFVTTLEDREAGEPPVTVELLVFGRTVDILVPPTQDLGKIDDALKDLEADPTGLLDRAFVEGFSTMGTALNEAVEKGIQETERIQDFRRTVTDSGVLTSGTLVVITDGKDESNRELNEGLIEETFVNVISIGISSEINGDALRIIGRDGTFLAPLPKNWAEAFDEVAKRVDEHPDRAYMLAYCSSRTDGQPSVSVALSDKTAFGDVSSAECTYDAAQFDPRASCGAEFLEDPCAGIQCGSLFACGGCAGDQCCAHNECKAPLPAPDCNDQDQLCGPGATCVDTGMGTFRCTPALAEGEPCGEGIEGQCELGVATCKEITGADGGAENLCQAHGNTVGSNCGVDEGRSGDPLLCPSLHCARRAGESSEFVCKASRARMFEPCGGSDAEAICELGTTCKGSTCSLRAPSGLFECSADEDCMTGFCNTASRLCDDRGLCHYSWNDQLDR